MPKYNWLKQLKEQKKQARLQQQPQNMFSGAPIGARYANDTGYGPDGRLQTDRPVARMDTQQGPRMIHEGEQLRPNGGNVNVVSQRQLIDEESRLGTPGFQNGGMFTPRGPDDFKRPNDLIGRPDDISRPDRVTNQQTGMGRPIIGPRQNIQSVGTPQLNKVTPKNLNPQTIGNPVQNTIPQNINIPNPVNPIQGVRPQDINIANPVNPMQGKTISQGTGVNQKYQNWAQGKLGDVTYDPRVVDQQGYIPDTQDNVNQKYKDWEQGKIGTGVSYPTDQVSDGGPVGTQDVPDPVVDPNVQQQDESQYSDAVKYALEQFRKLSEGGSPAQQAAYQKYIDGLKATQATGRRVGAQQAAQEGVTGVEAQTRELVAARDAGMQLAEATAQAGISAMQSRENALNSLAQLGLQGQQLEQGADQWQQQFDFAKEKYGDLEGQRLFADINAGMTFDQIQAKYPQSGITQGDFDSMKNATPLSQWEKAFGFERERFDETLKLQREQFGLTKEQFDEAKKQYDFDKKMSAVKALMAQGGAENFSEASKMFKDMFGESIDFSNAINEENSQNFTDGMAQMSAYLASGMDWDAASKAMDQDGTLDKLGMIPEQIEHMYNQMKLQSNPIYQADKAYQSLVKTKDNPDGLLTQKEKDQIMDIMVFALKNPEGVDVSDKWIVKDKDGKQIGIFDTEEEAGALVKENAQLGYQSEFVENHISLSGQGTGDTSGTGTPKLTYQKFKEDFVPAEDQDWFTQKEWQDMGSPKTWEEVESELGPVAGIYKKNDRDGTVLTKDGGISMNDKDLATIIDAIDSGDKYAVAKYGIPEDSQISGFISAIKGDPLPTGGKFGLDMGGTGDEPFTITKEDVEKSYGKVTTYKDNTGKERKVVIKGYSEDTFKDSFVQSIDVVDAETGEKRTITYYSTIA